jgi:hypothetical protein
MTLKLQLEDVSATKISAIRKKASRLGLSPENYIKQLIEDDLSLDREASSRSFAELAEPFRKGLDGLSEQAIDRLSRRKTSRRRKRD